MHRNLNDETVFVAHGKESSFVPGEGHGCERNHDLPAGDAVVVGERERAPAEFGVPFDPIEQFLEWLHPRHQDPYSTGCPSGERSVTPAHWCPRR
jgi:hypothetical protein